MVVVVTRGPGKADIAPDPGRGPDPDPDKDQGLLNGTGMLEAQALAGATSPSLSQGVAVATRAAMIAATTTAAGRMTTLRRRMATRTPAEVRIMISPLPLPLRNLGTHPSLLLLLCC